MAREPRAGVPGPQRGKRGGARSKPEPVQARRAFSWAILGAICLLPIAAPPLAGLTAGGPGGYVSIINTIFAPMNWLRVADPDSDAGVSRVVDLTPQARALRSVREFELRSPLRADLDANELGIWRFTGRHVDGLQSSTHRAVGPFGTLVWRGDILYGYAGSFAQLLDSEGRQIQLQAGAARWALALSIEGAPNDSRPVRGFTFYDGPNAVADVTLAGGNVLVKPRDSGTRIMVDERLDGQPGAESMESGTRPMVLANAGTIRFSRNGVPAGAVFRLSWSQPTLSAYREFAPRLPDPRLSPYWSAAATTLAAVMPATSDPIRLTVDRDLDRSIQSGLNTVILNNRSQPIPYYRAGAVVMDASTGDILAMASALGPPNDISPAPPSQARLEGNSNLATLAVGSTAKVPMSAALLSQWPDLRHVRIVSASREFTESLGVKLGLRREAHPLGATPVDFETFLQVSSNKYATTLMLMGLARDPRATGSCPSDPYWLQNDSQPRMQAPVLNWPSAGCGQYGGFSGKMSSMEQQGGRALNWLQTYKMLFDANYLEEAPAISGRKTSIWSGLPVDAESRARYLASISPEFESFGLNYPRNIVGDYIELILGAGKGRWTTVDLAEAYSRIATGHRVNANLVRSDRPSPPLLLAPLGQVTPVQPGNVLTREARSAILSGMARVLRPRVQNPNAHNGTAHDLFAALGTLDRNVPAGQELRAYAKTGTPLLGYSVEIPARVALAELVAMHKLTLDDAGLPMMKKKAGETDEQALMRQPAQERGGYSAKTLARTLEDIRSELRQSGQSIGTRARFTLPTTKTFEKAGGRDIRGGTFVIVIGRYCAGNEDPESLKPIRALTLAVNVEARRGNANPAIDLTRELLAPGSRFAKVLMTDPQRGAVTCAAR